MKIEKFKKFLIYYLFLCVMFFVVGCGNNTEIKLQPEELLQGYMEDINKQHGDVAFDTARIYCNGEKQNIIIYYYGTGNNYYIDNAYMIYVTDKDGETEIDDSLDDISSLGKQLVEVRRLMREEEYDTYKKDNKEIILEQFNDFEEGYVAFDMLSVK